MWLDVYPYAVSAPRHTDDGIIIDLKRFAPDRGHFPSVLMLFGKGHEF